MQSRKSPEVEKLAQARSLAHGALGGVRGKELGGQENTPRWPSNARTSYVNPSSSQSICDGNPWERPKRRVAVSRSQLIGKFPACSPYEARPKGNRRDMWNLTNLGKKYPYVTGVSRSRVLPAASGSNLIVKRMPGTISEHLRRLLPAAWRKDVSMVLKAVFVRIPLKFVFQKIPEKALNGS